MSDIRKLTVIMGVVAAMSSYAAPVQAKGLLEQWFPFLFTEEIPDSLPAQGGKMAPFQNSAPLPQEGEGYRPADAVGESADAKKIEYAPPADQPSAVALDQAHRQPPQMAAWASRAMSDTLDFDPLRYEAHLLDLNTLLTPYAQEAFKAFMAKENLLEALKSNNLVMRAFVTEPGRVLNQGAIQGRYRWLIETPVTISFMPRGISDYEGIQPKSQRINVRVQVGRVAEGGRDGVLIETMEFLPAEAK